MKATLKIKSLGIALALGTFVFACDQETRRETNAETTELRDDANKAIIEAENEVGEFSAWVDRNASRAENATREEWQEIKAEFKRQEAELDARSNTWDEKAKAEWRELKDSWKRTEERAEARLNRK
jgi:hypothetical protein